VSKDVRKGVSPSQFQSRASDATAKMEKAEMEMEIHKSIESKMSKMDSLQAVVDNIEDEMGVFRAEMEANS